MKLALGNKKLVHDLEGPGLRMAYWFQGCSLRCPGCCNPHLFSFSGGAQVEVTELIKELKDLKRNKGLQGVSLLGGEPCDQSESLLMLVKACKETDLSVMLYSGYSLDELEEDEFRSQVLEYTDLLVCGRFVEEKRELTRRWIGSSNQRLLFLSDRYDPSDPVFYKSNEVEFKLQKGRIEVTGFPVVNPGEIRPV